MKGLEIIMDIETLEVYEVIDHDQEVNLESAEKEEIVVYDGSVGTGNVYQLNLFEELSLLNTS